MDMVVAAECWAKGLRSRRFITIGLKIKGMWMVIIRCMSGQMTKIREVLLACFVLKEMPARLLCIHMYIHTCGKSVVQGKLMPFVQPVRVVHGRVTSDLCPEMRYCGSCRICVSNL